MSTRSPFARHELEGTPLYEALKAGIADLTRNQDLHLTTPYEKVVGHLVKKVIQIQPHHDLRKVM